MSTVLLVHSDVRAREGLATSLGAMGFKVVSVPDIETALDVAGQETSSLLVEPSLLAGEEFEVQTRLDLRAGHAVRILALTHRAQPAEMAILRRHGAGLLARPLEDLERLATMLRIHASESAPAPWEPAKRAAPAAVPDHVRERSAAPSAAPPPARPPPAVPAATAPSVPSVPPPWAMMPPLPAPTANPWVSPAVEPAPPVAKAAPPVEKTHVVPVTPPAAPPRPAPVVPPPSLMATRSPWAEEEDEDTAPDAPSADLTSREATDTRSSQSPASDRPFTFTDDEGEKTSEVSLGPAAAVAVPGVSPGFRPGPRAPVTPTPSNVRTMVVPDPLAPEATPAWPPPAIAPEMTPAWPPPASSTPGFDPFDDMGTMVSPENTIPDEPTAAGEGAGGDAGYEREPTPLDAGLSGPSVLVVEDDPTFRGFLRESLTSQGYRVHTAINASNALRLLKTGEPIDLVISDLNMPHMDGFELKHEIDQWLNKSMPFIVCTADPTEDKIQTAAQVGAAALVPKPIEDLDAFFAIVLDTLRDAKVVT